MLSHLHSNLTWIQFPRTLCGLQTRPAPALLCSQSPVSPVHSCPCFIVNIVLCQLLPVHTIAFWLLLMFLRFWLWFLPLPLIRLFAWPMSVSFFNPIFRLHLGFCLTVFHCFYSCSLPESLTLFTKMKQKKTKKKNNRNKSFLIDGLKGSSNLYESATSHSTLKHCTGWTNHTFNS